MMIHIKQAQAVNLILIFSLLLLGSAQGASVGDPRILELIQQGQTAVQKGNYREALKAFNEANKLSHNRCSTCYVGLTVVYSHLGDSRGAEENSKKAVETAADSAERLAAHTLRGKVLMSWAAGDPKRMAGAEAEFRQALQEEKNDELGRFELGTILLRQGRDPEGIAELQKLLQLNPSGKYTERAQKLIANPRRARERFAPDFELSTLQGETYSLAQLSKRVVVLDFWATWCPACRASLPELKDLLKKYPREKVVLISVSADDDENAWREFVAKKNMNWPQVRDTNHQITSIFGVHAFPTYLVISGEGIIQQEIVGTNPQQTVAYRIKETLKNMKELNAEK